MLAILNMSWLGEKGISLMKGKNWSTKGGFFFSSSNFLYILGSKALFFFFS